MNERPSEEEVDEACRMILGSEVFNACIGTVSIGRVRIVRMAAETCFLNRHTGHFSEVIRLELLHVLK